MQNYKATGYLTLFDEEERQQRLSKIGNPLGSLSVVSSVCQAGTRFLTRKQYGFSARSL